MKRIKIAFSDFWPSFKSADNFILDKLRERYEVVVCDNMKEADYLFFSVHGEDYLDFHGVRILISMENLAPDFNLCDYAIGFEHMVYEDRYVRYPVYYWGKYRKSLDRTLNRNLSELHAPEKRDFCSVVISNNLFADPYRVNLFKALSDYKFVASGGRAFNNLSTSKGVLDKIEFISNYKFNIACENGKYSGYTTEKIVDAFAANTVPIYWGDPRITEYFNPDSFINCTGLTIEEAVQKVREIDVDDEKYLKMLKTDPILDREEIERADAAYEKWLFNIFDQDLCEAKRIPTQGKMTDYENNYRKRSKLERKLKSYKKLYAFAKKLGFINRL